MAPFGMAYATGPSQESASGALRRFQAGRDLLTTINGPSGGFQTPFDVEPAPTLDLTPDETPTAEFPVEGRSGPYESWALPTSEPTSSIPRSRESVMCGEVGIGPKPSSTLITPDFILAKLERGDWEGAIELLLQSL